MPFFSGLVMCDEEIGESLTLQIHSLGVSKISRDFLVQSDNLLFEIDEISVL